jgi:hypothetical protein
VGHRDPSATYRKPAKAEQSNAPVTNPDVDPIDPQALIQQLTSREASLTSRGLVQGRADTAAHLSQDRRWAWEPQPTEGEHPFWLCSCGPWWANQISSARRLACGVK